MKEHIKKVSEGINLTQEEAQDAMRTIMDGNASDSQIAAFLTALKMKGETTEELLAFVQTMREKSLTITVRDPDAIDLCGTGGDGKGTFNISTVASFVAAGAGVVVAKHGNRSISSQCGSADLMKALGVNIEIPPKKMEQCINDIGIGFLFAPIFHPSMKFAARARTEMGIKTSFNLLGPLTNPAGVQRQLVGTFSLRALEQMSDVFMRLKPKKVILLHSDDGLDEVSIHRSTNICEINGRQDRVFSRYIPKQPLFAEQPQKWISGGTADHNAILAMNILRGERCPQREIVILNAAFALFVADKVHSIEEGISLAEDSIDSGNAFRKLEDLRTYTNS